MLCDREIIDPGSKYLSKVGRDLTASDQTGDHPFRTHSRFALKL